MKSIKEFFNSIVEAVVAARKARAEQLVNGFNHGK